mmetsp:Transcript_78892/g.139654  ORF Transcript_78892/g.139654 Transcript_78892/m.139654 type:complete len:303 (+) Transcript_78892:67-975(+)
MGNSQSLVGVQVAEASLHSDPRPPGKVRVVCISDTHNLHADLTDPTNPISLPEGDILLCAGDISYCGTWNEVCNFVEWFAQQPHAHKVFIAGNHDIGLEHVERGNFEGIGEKWKKTELSGDDTQNPAEVRSRLQNLIAEKQKQDSKIHYLEDSGIKVDGVRIWGSPWTPAIILPGYLSLAAKLTVGLPGRMAFNLMSIEEQRTHWAKIPKDVDIVVTHGPPHGFGDRTRFGSHVGDQVLAEELLQRVRPQFHVFGHIHEGHSAVQYDHGAGNGQTIFINAAVCDMSHHKVSQPPIVFDVTPR